MPKSGAILHVTQPVSGGTAAVVRQLALIGQARGRQVVIACPPGELAEWAEQQWSEQQGAGPPGIQWMDIALERDPCPGDLRAVRQLRGLMRQVEVVNLHSSKAGAVGRLALATLPRRARPRCLFTPHAWSWYVGGRAAPLYRQFERRMLRWTDAVAAVSTAEAHDGRAVLGAAGADKIVVIENAVDTRHFSPEETVARPNRDQVVVCVGRLCTQKGQDVLLRALSQLTDRTTRLYLVGEGPAEPALQDLTSELGLEHQVTFVSQADPRPYLRAADLVVIPSRWEGLSLVLLEAMACGAAIVVSREAAGDVIGDAGVVVAGDDPSALAADMTRLLADGARRAALGRRARIVAKERYSLDRLETNYEELITWMCEGETHQKVATFKPSAWAARDHLPSGSRPDRPSNTLLTPAIPGE